MDIKGRYLTTFDYNKIKNNILDGKGKNKELVNQFDIFKFTNNSDLDKKTSNKSIIKSRTR